MKACDVLVALLVSESKYQAFHSSIVLNKKKIEKSILEFSQGWAVHRVHKGKSENFKL